MPGNAFLTETRREVLNGEYDGTDNARRGIKSQTRQDAVAAVRELQKIASSPQINNADVFDPDELYSLLMILTVGTGGLIAGPDNRRPLPDDVSSSNAKTHAWRPDPDYAREVYVVLDRVLRDYQDKQQSE